MVVYVLYDCIETPTDWATAGIEHVYIDYTTAYMRMKELYERCEAEYLDDNDTDGQEETYIDGYGARVYNSVNCYRHTWAIVKEMVA